MPASQKDHDRNLPMGMSFPGRQNPVVFRLGQSCTQPAMGHSIVWAHGHKTAPEPGKGFAPLLCTSDHIVNIILHAGKTFTN